MNAKWRKFWGKDAAFSRACKLADVPETQRQYRKFVRGFGAAHKASREEAGAKRAAA